MVFSDVPGLTKTRMCKPIQNQLLFPMNPTDIVPLDHVELDFADVFGPLPVQTPSEMNPGDSGDSVSAADTNDLIYGDPVVIYSRSHSLVGPSTCLSQSLKLSKLALHEIEDSEELVECLHEEAVKELQRTSSSDDISEKSFEDIDSDSTTVETVGLEDFEVMKLVGQGAFGKVFQVRKRNTSEIYAMKVMRKDKIMEKDHAEYMKAERDILTKVDHPFIVQLRYSFQVLSTSIKNRLFGLPLFPCFFTFPYFLSSFLSKLIIISGIKTCSTLTGVVFIKRFFPEQEISIYFCHKTISLAIFNMQTKYRLYLVLDFVNGGHLFFQLYNHGLFRYLWF